MPVHKIKKPREFKRKIGVKPMAPVLRKKVRSQREPKSFGRGGRMRKPFQPDITPVAGTTTSTSTTTTTTSSLPVTTTTTSTTTTTTTTTTVAPGVAGTLWSWGYNSDYGELGLGDVTNRSSPVQVGALGTWASITAGYYFSFGLNESDELFSWGRDQYGSLGHGTSATHLSSPVQVGSLTDWTDEMSAGLYHAGVVKDDGTLWMWGRNEYGEVGNGAQGTPISSPIQIGALTDWAKVACGEYFTVAIKTNGTIWSWGANAGYGQLGQGDVTVRSSPTQIGALTDWADVSCGDEHVIAIKTNGTIWSWGDGASGKLGDGTTTKKSSPVQIGSATDWTIVETGLGTSYAINDSGELWAWGAGDNGGLGTGGGASLSTPTQVGALTTWEDISAGLSYAIALQTDGTLWAWGANASGQVGNGSVTNVSTPTQIGSDTDWTAIYAGRDHSLALRSI